MKPVKNSPSKFLSIHRWTGLVLGLLILLSAVSGLGLAFRKQLEPVVHADLLRSNSCPSMAPLDLLLSNAQKAYGAHPPEYIRIYGDPMAAARVRFKDNDTVYLDRCTGAVLGEMNRYKGVFGSIEQLHTLRYWKSGSTIVASVALGFLVILIMGGLYLVYPLLRRDPARALKVDRRIEGAGRQLSRHRTFALWVFPVALLSALTGLPQGFGWLEEALYSLDAVPTPPKPKSAQVSVATVPVEQVRQRLDELLPQAQEALIKIPRKPGEAYEIYAMAKDAWHANARNYIYVDAGTGELLSFRPYEKLGIGSKIYYAAISLHTGMPAGLFGQTVMFLAAIGLIAAILAGYRSFLGRRAVERGIKSPNGQVTIPVEVSEAVDISPNTRMLRLIAAGSEALPPPSAGCHIDVQCVPGTVRQYSVVNGPDDRGHYEIAVRRAEASRGGSAAMHRVEVGSRLLISAPRNNFGLVDQAKHHLLIASGIGITPILSMARQLATQGASWSLHYFVRSEQTAAYAAVLRSAPLANHVTIHESIHPSLYSLKLKEIITAPQTGTHLYFCGGEMLMEAAEAAAEAQGWPTEAVHREFFSATQTGNELTNEPFVIELARSGEIISVAADQSILAALSDNGTAVASSCEEGICGTCLTRVIAGEIDHRDAVLSQAQREEGKLIMVCVSRAKGGKLVLDL